MIQTIETSEKIYTVQEWLELEKTSEIRHEYYYGKLIKMPGEAKQANRIANNIVKKLDDLLLEKGFEIFSHDVKTQVLDNGIYRYPDLVIAPIADDEDDYIVQLPIMLVEVASESSKHRDRVKKSNEYRNIPTLWYYLVINQDEMLVEKHSREAGGFWSIQYFTEPEDEITLPNFGLTLRLNDIYNRVKL
jgi:Uma2 family endonuclease